MVVLDFFAEGECSRLRHLGTESVLQVSLFRLLPDAPAVHVTMKQNQDSFLGPGNASISRIKPRNPGYRHRRRVVEMARCLLGHSFPLLSRHTALLPLAMAFLVAPYLADVNWVHAVSMFLAEAGSLNNELSLGLTPERATA